MRFNASSRMSLALIHSSKRHITLHTTSIYPLPHFFTILFTPKFDLIVSGEWGFLMYLKNFGFSTHESLAGVFILSLNLDIVL